MILHIVIFIVSFLLIFWSGSFLLASLKRISRFLKWREFVVAFFIMAVASSLPNLFVGITSALSNIPELSFGDVVGGNVVDLTLVIALAALVNKGLPANSRMIQASSVFTLITAIFPLLLVSDGRLSRADGILLILAFVLYTWWLFRNKKDLQKHTETKQNAWTVEG